jgi:hypothetical protein
VRLHVSAVTCAPEEGTVELTVDSRYRDLLTVQESINRTRDPLTPVKMLQINKTSLMIPDVQAPWDYSAGAGCVPLPSKDFHRMCPEALAFPYQSFTKKYPPTSHPEFYVKVNANSSDATGQARWAGPISVLTSTKGSISRSEFAMYDKAGNVLPWYFHVSFYQNNNIDYSNMPRDSHGLYSPFIDNGFEETNPATGMPWATTSDMGPPPDLLVGWGSQTMEKMNRAGFSPGSEADGSSPTGLLIDNLVWNYDSSKNLEYAPDLPAGYPQPDGALNIYGMFYAEIPPGSAIPQQAVYFMGRLFHQNAGSDSA